ncbi:zinc ribbon domain-containing protein [Longimicrobium sp.]|jgi:hypothetical protein|uniref:zinc ribbon domain-containing protein n=1 Tax=Longimicrobium sp. TaxID=2029185 RepID=UPI002ED9C228
MKSCRDCGQPAAASARSCPHCGILNPVVQWVALPDGEHLTHRESVKSSANPFAYFAAPSTANAAALAGPAYATQARAAADQDAIEAINVAATRFFWVAGFTLVFGYVLRDVVGQYWYADGVIVGALAFALKEMHSRVAAGLLLAFSALTVLMQVLELFGGSFFIGRIVLWVVFTGMSYRALMATIALHKQQQGTPALAR